MLLSCIKAMRPKQWAKNVFLFAAIVFSLKFDDPSSIYNVITAFFAFSFVSSSGYILNDARDIEVDKSELYTEYSNHFRECLNERDRMVLHMHSRDIRLITIEEITGINNVPQVKERAINKIRAYLAENSLNEQNFREDLSILGLENILS